MALDIPDSQSFGHVFVLGAGFSKAISEAMPTMADLTKHLKNNKELSGKVPQDDWILPKETFEMWLSRLAEPQPYLRTDANLRRAWSFELVRSAVANYVAECQEGAIAGAAPPWLLRLIRTWHVARATVITLNYDVLVEVALNSMVRVSFGAPNLPEPTDILDGMPPVPAGRQDVVSVVIGSGLDPRTEPRPIISKRATFKLLKLHGSLAWYSVAGDPSGATLRRWPVQQSFGTSKPDDDEEIRRTFPGRDRFIVPPSFVKSSYFNNPVIRELWTRAHEALSAARRVVVIGYSMPAPDIAMASVLLEGLQSASKIPTSPVEVDIIDLEPPRIRKRLSEFGLADSTKDKNFTRIEKFVDHYADLLARETAQRLLEVANEARDVLASLDSDESAPYGQISLATPNSWAHAYYLDLARLDYVDASLVVGMCEDTSRARSVDNQASKKFLEALLEHEPERVMVGHDDTRFLVIGFTKCDIPPPGFKAGLSIELWIDDSTEHTEHTYQGGDRG